MKMDLLENTCDNTVLLFEKNHLMNAVITHTHTHTKTVEKVCNVTCEGCSVARTSNTMTIPFHVMFFVHGLMQST